MHAISHVITPRCLSCTQRTQLCTLNSCKGGGGVSSQVGDPHTQKCAAPENVADTDPAGNVATSSENVAAVDPTGNVATSPENVAGIKMSV